MIVFITIAMIQNIFAQDTTSLILQKMITDYLQIKKALTIANSDSTRVYAGILFEDLSNFPLDKLSAGHLKIWNQYSGKLINTAKKISSNSDLKNQRKQFADLSSEFYKMLSAMKVNTIDLYYQYCPMADAFWISENSKIANPYYGKQMLSCGSTKETLKAIK